MGTQVVAVGAKQVLSQGGHSDPALTDITRTDPKLTVNDQASYQVVAVGATYQVGTADSVAFFLPSFSLLSFLVSDPHRPL